MSDVLSRILGGLMNGGQSQPQQGGYAGGSSSPLGTPRLPADEGGRFGGSHAPETGGLGGMLGGGLGGGLGGILGGLLGGGRSQQAPAPSQGGLGGLASGLGGMKGVALMALLAYLMNRQGGRAGLSSLTDTLRGAGLGNHVDSWISSGPNQTMQPDEVARVIPADALQAVEQQTGMGRDEVLSELSRGLPQMVDRLTPQGRLPERDDELNDHDERDVLGGFSPWRRS